MTLGKKIFQIAIHYCLFSSSLSSTLSPSVLRGGLVYSEESSLGPVYLNRDYVSFVRTVDTSVLEQSAQATRDFTTLYHTLCRTIKNHVTPFDRNNNRNNNTQTPAETHEIIFSPVKYPIKEGRQVCKNMGARLPEIRNTDSYNKFRFAAITKHISKFPAGIYFDQKTQTFRYDSDHTPANRIHGGSPFTSLHYGGFWTGGNYPGDWEKDSTILGAAPDWFILYNDPKKDFTVRQADSIDQVYKEYIMCEKPIDRTFEKTSKETNILLQLASNACIRDERALVASTQYILSEIEAITNLNITVKEYTPKMEDFFPIIIDDEEEITEENQVQKLGKKRRKRRQVTTTLPSTNKTKEEVDKDVDTLNNSFKILISLLDRPKFTTETPTTSWTWTPMTTKKQTTTTTTASTTTTQSHEKSEVKWHALPTEKPLAHTIPRYLMELYHLYTIQKTAEVHQLPFDIWMYRKATQRHRQRLLTDVYRGRRNFPEQTRPDIYLSTLLYNSSDVTKETSLRAEIYATNIMYKQVIDKRVTQAIDDYLDSVILEDSDTNKTTFSSVFEKVRTNINSLTINEEHPQARTRRTPIGPIAVAGTAFGATNAVSSAFTGDAPLSWIGDALGLLLGFPTKNSAEFKQIAKNAKNIDALSINQNTLAQSFNFLSKRLNTFGNLILKSFKAAATTNMEQDLKQIVRHMQTIQQLTLTKYANVLMAGQLGKTSPYAITYKELQAQRAQLKIDKGITITDRIEETKSSVAIVNNTIQILIQVPILDEQKLFNFYHIRALPVFKENKTFVPVIDSEYVAISRTGSYYTEVSSAEFTRCVILPDQCQVSSPATPVGSRSMCVINTFIERRQHCPLQEVAKPPEPVILISGNRTIYSVPYETYLYVKCHDHTTYKHKEETINISGMGEASFRPSCSITLPGGATFNTPADTIEESMSDSKLFENLRTYDTPTNVVIRRLPEKFPDLPIITLHETDSTDTWENAFSPDNQPFFIRLASVVIALFLVLILTYFFCPSPFKNCCQKAYRSKKKRQDQMKQDYQRAPNLDEEQARQNEILLHHLAHQMDELTKPNQEVPKRWPSAGLLTSFGRSRPSSQQVDPDIPPPVGSPHLSYKLKDVENGHLTSPILKRVQFDQPPTQ